MSFCHGTLFHSCPASPVAHKKFVSFQNKMNDSALAMVPESNKLTINRLNHVGCGLFFRALLLPCPSLVFSGLRDPAAKSSVLVTAIPRDKNP